MGATKTGAPANSFEKMASYFFLLLNYIVDGGPQGLLLPRFPQWSEHTNSKNEIYFLGNKK